MNVFIDANILVSVINKEYPLFTETARIMSLHNQKGFRLFTTPVCLAIAFYFAQKKNKKTARDKLLILSRHIIITEISATTVEKVVSDKRIHDFEDGLEYYSAIENNCNCIITEDTGDFYFSEIEVLNSNAFFKKYMTKNH